MPARKLNLVTKPQVVHRTNVQHQGRKFRVEFYDVVSETPAELLSVDLARFVLAQGWSHGLLYSWDNKAAALFDGDKVIATINWSFEDDCNRNVRLNIGGTDPNYRRQGFYRVLNDAWVAYLAEFHPTATAIFSGYHVDNKESAVMQKSFGRQITHVETRQDIPRQHQKKSRR